MIALILSGGIAAAITLFGMPLFIRFLRTRGIGQPIRDDGPQAHLAKAGTPTMGGVVMMVAFAVAYLLARTLGWVLGRSGPLLTGTGLALMFLVLGGAVVGGMDDLIKVRHARSLGLNPRSKMIGQLSVAFLFAVYMVWSKQVKTTLSITRHNSTGLDLGVVGWVLLALFFIIGFSNAVNLTDGLDGLASGAGVFAFSAFTIIGFWQFRHQGVYQVPNALDAATIATALVGSCVGFLWWNAAPARIFMGDVGSLALGAGLAGLALVTNTHLLLPLVGGLFVMETVSVMAQVFSYKVFKKRILKMAPIHHHFEQIGWPETTVIIRFWIIGGLCTALALGAFYADYLQHCPGTGDSPPECSVPGPFVERGVDLNPKVTPP